MCVSLIKLLFFRNVLIFLYCVVSFYFTNSVPVRELILAERERGGGITVQYLATTERVKKRAIFY